MTEILFETIQRLPKVELHLHLEGSVRRDTFVELSHRRGTDFSSGTVNWETEGFRYKDLSQFVYVMSAVSNTCVRQPEDYERIASELFADLSSQNVRYAEVSFDLARVMRLGISLDEVFDAINSAKQRATSDTSLRIGLILGMNRGREPETISRIAHQAVEWMDNGVVGIDLHGDESVASPGVFTDAFSIARKAGLGLRAHAGEGVGADSIWEALKILGVSRIGHGVRALEDDELIEYLKEHQITLDICPTSNYMLNVVPSLSDHPIRKLFDLGIPVTVSTDDPLYFNTGISKEYYILARYLGFTLTELKQVTLNAVNGAFLEETLKKSLYQEIERDFTI